MSKKIKTRNINVILDVEIVNRSDLIASCQPVFCTL